VSVFDLAVENQSISAAITHSPPAKSKMATRAPKMATGVLKGVQPLVIGCIGCSEQLLVNRFLYPSTLSMRGVDNGEKKEIIVKIVVP